jgi:hypothetical protein
MDVKQAVSIAFQQVQDLFANEQLSNLGLEEQPTSCSTSGNLIGKN